jgi:transcriptional regulator with XRE-family HTH domain
MNDVEAFGKRVEQQRRIRHLSIRDLESRTGLSYQSIWRIERGVQGEPGVFTAAKLARALDCSIDYLCGFYAEREHVFAAAAPDLVGA